MATIKSFTSLEQSRRLGKFLPIESADMHYNVVGDAIIGDYQSGISSARSVAKAWKKNPDEFAKKVIPCWSLAALLNVLPSSTLDSSDNHRYRFRCMERYTEWYDNAIDACVAMIEKLHELKIL